MKTYEITFITKEDLKDKPVKDILTGLDGKILNTSSIGEKQFAYKIKKENRGFYSTILFEIDPEKLPDLNKKLSLDEEIIRFLIVAKKPSQLLVKEPKATKKIEMPLEIAAPELIDPPKKIEAIPAKEVARPKKITKKIEKAVKPKVSKEVTEIEKETESEEDRLKALDEKLDELLKE